MADVLSQALDYLAQGGWIMIPLGICSIAMWILIFERFQAYAALTRKDIGIARAVEAVQAGSLQKQRDGMRATLVDAYLGKRAGEPELDAKILQECALEQRAELKRYLSFIAVLAAVAPLLGLLGTVLGMIETFEVISFFGTGNAKAMAGGISVALVTTQTGLLVAIPGILVSGVLSKRAAQLQNQLDEITSILVRIIRRSGAPVGEVKGAHQ